MEKVFSKINKKELIKTFVNLVKINSISYQEEEINKYLTGLLSQYGLKIKLQKYKNTANLVAFFKGNKKGLPLFFNAHTDTVEPGKDIRPIVTDTLIKSDGTTILGADDKAAIAVFLEGIRYIKKYKIKHPDLYFVFTSAEELGLVGAKNFDSTLLKPTYGFNFDADGKPGTAILSAPTHYKYHIVVYGKSAHAGVEPEKGVNAIKICAELIRKIRTGKIDFETTANVGKISGGIATNIVPDNVILSGEVRSRNNEKLKIYINNLRKIISRVQRSYNTKIKLDLTNAYNSYKFTKEDKIVEKFIKACRYAGIKPGFEQSNGGSDCNIFNQQRFKCLNLGIGMARVHSKMEYILIKDLMNCLKLFLSLVINW